jgi:DNA-binding NarL/FixJ family response regulator
MLNIRETTVEFHLRAVFDKAGVDNRATLVARVLEL